jgi:hypothetical protein
VMDRDENQKSEPSGIEAAESQGRKGVGRQGARKIGLSRKRTKGGSMIGFGEVKNRGKKAGKKHGRKRGHKK